MMNLRLYCPHCPGCFKNAEELTDHMEEWHKQFRRTLRILAGPTHSTAPSLQDELFMSTFGGDLPDVTQFSFLASGDENEFYVITFDITRARESVQNGRDILAESRPLSERPNDDYSSLVTENIEELSYHVSYINVNSQIYKITPCDAGRLENELGFRLRGRALNFVTNIPACSSPTFVPPTSAPQFEEDVSDVLTSSSNSSTSSSSSSTDSENDSDHKQGNDEAPSSSCTLTMRRTDCSANSSRPKLLQKLYKCPHCTSFFRALAELRVHIYNHGVGKPFPCHYCSATFHNLSARQLHQMRRHADDVETEMVPMPNEIPCNYFPDATSDEESDLEQSLEKVLETSPKVHFPMYHSDAAASTSATTSFGSLAYYMEPKISSQVRAPEVTHCAAADASTSVSATGASISVATTGACTTAAVTGASTSAATASKAGQSKDATRKKGRQPYPFPCPRKKCNRRFLLAEGLARHLFLDHPEEESSNAAQTSDESSNVAQSSDVSPVVAQSSDDTKKKGRQPFPFPCPHKGCRRKFLRAAGLALHLKQKHPDDGSSNAAQPSDRSSNAAQLSDRSSNAAQPSNRSSNAAQPSNRSSNVAQSSDGTRKKGRQPFPFPCPHKRCSRRFLLAAGLAHHLKQNHPEDGSSNAAQSSHGTMKKDRPKNPFLCTHRRCPKSFKTKIALDYHIIRSHPDDAVAQNNPESENYFDGSTDSPKPGPSSRLIGASTSQNELGSTDAAVLSGTSSGSESGGGSSASQTPSFGTLQYNCHHCSYSCNNSKELALHTASAHQLPVVQLKRLGSSRRKSKK